MYPPGCTQSDVDRAIETDLCSVCGHRHGPDEECVSEDEEPERRRPDVRVCPECREPIIDGHPDCHKEGCSVVTESDMERDRRRAMNRAKRHCWEQAEELRDEGQLGRLWDIA